MSDRLTELRRQRALVQEHLAWLDREIAGATPAPSSIEPRQSAPTFPANPTWPSLDSSPAPTVASTPALAATDDALLDQYRVAPSALRSEVQKGCLLLVAATLILFLGVFGLWFAFRG